MRYGVFFSNSTTAEHGFLLPNHMAASLKDSTGDRAQHLAEAYDAPVLAFERPFTADLPMEAEFNPDSYRADVDARAQRIKSHLDIFGIERVTVCGNSAGALDALALAATGKLALNRVIAIEPVGMRNIPKHINMATWVKEQLKKNKTQTEGEYFAGLPELHDVRPAASRARLARRMHKEAKAYGLVYRSDVGHKLLRNIAANQPDLPVNLVLADRSFTTTPPLLEELAEEFAETSIRMEIIPGATHGFPDPHHHFLHVIQSAVGSPPGVSRTHH